jgi:hypothetical protein
VEQPLPGEEARFETEVLASTDASLIVDDEWLPTPVQWAALEKISPIAMETVVQTRVVATIKVA